MNSIILIASIVLPIGIFYLMSKYKKLYSEEGLLYVDKYCEYRIPKIAIHELEQSLDYDSFIEKCEIKKNSINVLCYVILSEKRIISGGIIDTENFMDKSKKIGKCILNKKLKVAFYYVEQKSSVYGFFNSLVNIDSLRFIEYVSTEKIVMIITSLIAITSLLFYITSNNMYTIMGIPNHTVLNDTLQFSQYVIADIFLMIINWTYSMIIKIFSFFSYNSELINIIVLFLLYYIIFKICDINLINNIKILFNKISFDVIIFSLIYSLMGTVVLFVIIINSILIMSNGKMKFPNLINNDFVIFPIGDYVHATGYPRIGMIDDVPKYIVSYDKHYVFFYDISNANNDLYEHFIIHDDIDKRSNKVKEREESFKNLCAILENEKLEMSKKFNSIILRHPFIKPQYAKTVRIDNAKITEERPMQFEDFYTDEFKAVCRSVIKID